MSGARSFVPRSMPHSCTAMTLRAATSSASWNSFWVVRDRDEREFGSFQTRDLILDAYDAMGSATPDFPFLSRLDPPPGDPRVAHSRRPGEDPGHWIPWNEVLARAPQAAAAARPIRIATTLPVKPGSTRVARHMPEPARSLFAPDPAAGWQPEAAIAPSDIVMGIRVRHPAKGQGTVLSVRPSGRSTELLIRFDATGETWIVFGYGVLEFEARPGASVDGPDGRQRVGDT